MQYRSPPSSAFAALKAFERFDPFPLCPIRMQYRHRMLYSADQTCDRRRICSAENQRAVEIRSLEQSHYKIEFLFSGNSDKPRG